ncbi:MAG: L-aspartate oxidase [uncultured Thermomicrobiales bacterium]|uniref:L-aspartate oxidase n=1 Tax=uncultured Thermomicrobiales bacterium TaxID=1645740 RepID=A0A6J4U9U8_9BACT|nr:MAG: L-aspartate oxidase [uncultured Thermomicrobiales bacterium]
MGAEVGRRGLDLASDLLPVAPAAHYAMGGVVASVTGETSLAGLLALGEISCTGVHGANRLASNSLLEGLVFGLAAADHLSDTGMALEMAPYRAPDDVAGPASVDGRAQLESVRRDIQRTMSRNVAVVRDQTGLDQAIGQLADLGAALPSATGREVAEVANMVLVARVITMSAVARQESRGGHFRADYPSLDPALDGRHLIRTGPGAGEWRFGSLADALSPLAKV